MSLTLTGLAQAKTGVESLDEFFSLESNFEVTALWPGNFNNSPFLSRSSFLQRVGEDWKLVRSSSTLPKSRARTHPRNSFRFLSYPSQRGVKMIYSEGERKDQEFCLDSSYNNNEAGWLYRSTIFTAIPGIHESW